MVLVFVWEYDGRQRGLAESTMSSSACYEALESHLVCLCSASIFSLGYDRLYSASTVEVSNTVSVCVCVCVCGHVC